MAGDPETRQVSRAAAAHEQPHGIRRQTEQELDPIEHHTLEVYRGMVAAGAARIKARREQ